MKLYLINVTILVGRNNADFQLTLEGDDPTADDGDWSAAGPAAPFLNSQDGYWKIDSLELGRGEQRTLLLKDDPNPGFLSWGWLWRGLPGYVAVLELPKNFPGISAQTSEGRVYWESDSDHQFRGIIWRLARRYF